jgi:hypothetical protein
VGRARGVAREQGGRWRKGRGKEVKKRMRGEVEGKTQRRWLDEVLMIYE